MTSLTKYEAARRALAEAHRVDEVKDIRDKAAAMQLYAMQAKDRELIEMATNLKLRAERRAGELLREMPKNKGSKDQLRGDIPVGGRAPRPPSDTAPKLSDIGITKDESSRWQKLAKMPEEQFEEKLAGVKSVMRAKTEGQKAKPKSPKRPKVTDPVKNKIIAAADAGVPSPKIAAEVGLNARVVHRLVQDEHIRREGQEEPEIDRALLSMSAAQKLDAAIRQHQHKLDLSFEQRVRDEVKRRIDEIVLPHWKAQIAEAKKLYEKRKGLMDKATFNKIRRGLHPDSRNSISDKVLGEAFDTFMSLEKFLLAEKDSPTEFSTLPHTWDDWEKAKRTTTAARRAKRNSHQQPARR